MSESQPAVVEQADEATNKPKRGRKLGRKAKAAKGSPKSGKRGRGRGVSAATIERQKFIMELFKNDPRMNLNRAKVAVKDKWGVVMQFDRIKEARDAFLSGKELPAISGEPVPSRGGRHQGGIASKVLVVTRGRAGKLNAQEFVNDRAAQDYVNNLLHTQDIPLSQIAIYSRRDTRIDLKIG